MKKPTESRDHIRVVTFRLYPRSESNARFLNNCFDLNRYAWNSALAHSKVSGINVGLSCSQFLTDFKNQPNNKAFSKISARIPEKEVQKLEVAREQAFKKVRGFPKFRGKDSTPSFYVDKANSELFYRSKKNTKQKVFLKISGAISNGKKLPARDFMLSGTSNYIDGQYLGCAIKKTPKGFWAFVTFNVKDEHVKKGITNGVLAAIDLNAKNFTLFSSKDKKFKVFYRPPSLDQTFELREKIQSDKDRRSEGKDLKKDEDPLKKGSRKFNEIKARIADLYKKETDIRKTRNHTVSREIADSCQVLFVEKIDYTKMAKSKKGTVEEPGEGVKRHSAATREFIGRAAPGDLVGKLNYKIWQMIYVNPAYTSRTCPNSDCGYIHKENRMSQENFTCLKCGFHDNADKVASINIYNRGLKILKDLGKLDELKNDRLRSISSALSHPRKQKDDETDDAFKARLLETIQKAAGSRIEELIKMGECNEPLDSFPKDDSMKSKNEGS